MTITTDLFVEVEESLGAVDVVEGSTAGHPAINAHGVDTQGAFSRHEQPVGVRAAHKHLQTQKHAMTMTSYSGGYEWQTNTCARKHLKKPIPVPGNKNNNK